MYPLIQRPTALLRPYIAQYWNWELPAGEAIPTIYAGTGVEYVFNLGDPIETIKPYSSIIPTGHSVLLCPRKKHFSAVGKGKINLISIRFRSAGFYQIFGIPLIDFIDRLTSAERIIPNELLGQLLDKKNLEISINRLEAYLLQVLNRRRTNEQKISYLIDKVYYQDNLKLSNLVQNSGMSESTFQRRFKLYTGVSGKYFQRTARFQSCIKSLLSPLN